MYKYIKRISIGFQYWHNDILTNPISRNAFIYGLWTIILVQISMCQYTSKPLFDTSNAFLQLISNSIIHILIHPDNPTVCVHTDSHTSHPKYTQAHAVLQSDANTPNSARFLRFHPLELFPRPRYLYKVTKIPAHP